VIGGNGAPALPMWGSLPPDLQGTLFRVGPERPWDRERVARGSTREDVGGDGGGDVEAANRDEKPGALHAVEIRDGKAVWYGREESDADAGVLWHAGSLLALPESGLPSQYSRFLEPEEFAGGLTLPIASHLHRLASDGSRVLFGIDDAVHRGGAGTGQNGGDDADDDGIFLRIGEWDGAGNLRTTQSVELERATWQHDIGVTATHVVFIESSTTRLLPHQDGAGAPVPFGWVPGTEGWLGVVPRVGDGSVVRWIRLDPCLVTHVLGAYDEPGDDETIVLYVCRYGVPESGQPVDLSASVVGPAGVGLSGIGGTLGVLERWRIGHDRVERVQVDDRSVEYPRMDAQCEGAPFRHGYCVETAWSTSPAARLAAPGPADPGESSFVGLLQIDLARDEVSTWNPGAGRTPSEPLFVRAVDGHGDDEGWLLTVVDDANRGATDLYVLDASSFGRRRPEAVIHLPTRLPLRSHGEWVPADRYR
jgi:carotenoid cleavage dioxygenase-like enzyme